MQRRCYFKIGIWAFEREFGVSAQGVSMGQLASLACKCHEKFKGMTLFDHR